MKRGKIRIVFRNLPPDLCDTYNLGYVMLIFEAFRCIHG